jgi:diacylglycerol kinase family enzyme
VKAHLEQSGIPTSIRATPAPGSGLTLARDAIAAGADLILVCGGDGTINEVVCGMARSAVPLAVLPGGTANGLARELRIPLDIEAAAQMIPVSTPRRIALGRVFGSQVDRYFISMVGVGFDAQVLTRIKRSWKDRLGMIHYAVEALRQAVWSGFTTFTVSAGATRLEATFACISRPQYYGPFRMIREADFFSDRFHVYCLPSKNLARYLVYALALLAGRLDRVADVASFPAVQVRCEKIAGSEGAVLFQVDGELAGRLPLTVEIVPDALTLLVPPQRTPVRAGRS